jgi:hypothetical protein
MLARELMLGQGNSLVDFTTYYLEFVVFTVFVIFVKYIFYVV